MTRYTANSEAVVLELDSDPQVPDIIDIIITAETSCHMMTPVLPGTDSLMMQQEPRARQIRQRHGSEVI
jgi:hypothetical protein